MTESFEEFTRRCRGRVEAAIAEHLPEPDQQQPQLSEAMAYSLSNGGKRIRPVLVYASAATLGRQPDAGLDCIATALESIHAYSLIHDDLPAMDDDDLRRGHPSCHIAYGEANAILAGDALQTLAFEVLAGAPGLPDERRLALIHSLAQAAGARGMVLGQAIDLGAVERELTLADLERMHRHKTGALIRASVVMAAQACAAEPDEIRALEQFALAVGLAFQVQDDILDVISDTKTLGKRQGADSALSKPTYVSLLGLEGAREKARELLKQALQSLTRFGPDAEPLRQLARYIVERNH